MSELILPSYSKMKPPVGTRLNTGHPLARGLSGCWLMNEGTGSVVRDLSGNGAVLTSTGSGVSWGQGPYGAVLVNNGADDGLYGATPSGMLYDAPNTIWFRFKPGNNGTSIFLDIKDKNNNRVATFGTDASNRYSVTRSLDVKNNTRDTSIVLDNTGLWYCVALVFNPSVDANRYTIYVDGIDVSADSSMSYWGLRGTANQMTVLERLAAGHEWSGSVSDFALFARAHSPSEIASLYRDPYQMFRRSPIEILTAAMDGGSGGTTYTETISDGLGLADVPSRASTFSRSFAESVGSTDALGNASWMIRQLTESLSIADSRIKAESKTLADPIGIVDALIDVWQASRTMTDTVGLSDETVGISVIVRTLADTLNVTDDVGRLWTVVRTIADAMGLSDAMSPIFSGAGNYVVTFSDTISTDDSIATAATLLRIMAENLGLSDGVTTLLVASRLVSDSLGITDGVVLARTMAVADTVGVSDDVTRLVQYLRTQSDTQGILDAMARVIEASRTIDDAVGMTDAMSRRFGDLAKAVCAFILLKRRR
jgi:hypothetical protein